MDQRREGEGSKKKRMEIVEENTRGVDEEMFRGDRGGRRRKTHK